MSHLTLVNFVIALGSLAMTAQGMRQGDIMEYSTSCKKPACAKDTTKAVFFDMVHSNNAARIRLFIRLYIGEEDVPICMVTYADMRCDWFKEVNPNQKVPAIVLDNDGEKETLYESNVILDYLVESHEAVEGNTKFRPYVFLHRTLPPIHRAKVNLMCRVHDLYIASPNCNQPGCTHSQGALYLPPPGEFDNTDGRRAVDATTRSGKFAELWTRWTWLEDYSYKHVDNGGPFLAGDQISLADLTIFPTAVFMEFLLSHVAEWPTLFADVQGGETRDFTADPSWGSWVSAEPWNPGPVAVEMRERFPKLTSWYRYLLENDEFRTVRAEILGFWLNERHLDSLPQPQKRIPRFPPIKNAIAESVQLPWKPIEVGGTLQWPAV